MHSLSQSEQEYCNRQQKKYDKLFSRILKEIHRTGFTKSKWLDAFIIERWVEFGSPEQGREGDPENYNHYKLTEEGLRHVK